MFINYTAKWAGRASPRPGFRLDCEISQLPSANSKNLIYENNTKYNTNNIHSNRHRHV
jgi:hypothetical protein